MPNRDDASILPPARTSTGLLNAALLTIVLWGAIVARPLLVPVCLAALVSFVITPVVRAFRRLKILEGLALTLTLMVFALPFFFVGYALVSQTQSLIDDFPKIMASFSAWLTQAESAPWAHRLHLERDFNVATLQSNLAHRAGEGLQIALRGLSALLDAGSTTGLVLIFAVLMVSLRGQLRQSAEKILARTSSRFSAPNLIDEMAGLVQNFLLARLLITVIVGALTAAMLMAFDVRYALLQGALLGALTMIPTIGFIVGMVPPLFVSALAGHSWLHTFSLFGAFMLLALFEANWLTPKLVGGKLNINSLFAFIGLFAGGLAWGVWGMLLSIPMLGILRICLTLSPSGRPWAELLAERDDSPRLLRRRRAASNAASQPATA